MSKLHIWTQDRENYGAHDWDGTGTCPEYWKNKGGEDFFVTDATTATADEIVESLRTSIEVNNNYYRTTIAGWQIVNDDYMTEFERSQMEYDQVILYPARCFPNPLK